MNCTVCCVSDAAVTYARDSFCGFSGGPFVLSGGGGGRHTGTRLTLVIKLCKLPLLLKVQNADSVKRRIVYTLKA